MSMLRGEIVEATNKGLNLATYESSAGEQTSRLTRLSLHATLGNSHQRLIRIAKVKLCDSLGHPGTGNVSSLRIVSKFGLCNKCIICANPNSDQLIVANFGSFGAADSKDQPAMGVRGAPSGFLRARPRVGLDESHSPFLSASPLHEEFCQETKSKTQPSCSHPVPTGLVRSRLL